MKVSIVAMMSFFFGCGMDVKEENYSFKIIFNNLSDYSLRLVWGFSASTGCDGPAKFVVTDSGMNEELEFTGKCASKPDHQVLRVSGPEGSALASYEFASEEFHVECSNDKCVNTVGDFAGTDAATKNFRFPLEQ